MRTETNRNLLVIGDVHGNYPALEKAINYAADSNLLLVSLGDLVDYGPQPFKCVKAMLNWMVGDGYLAIRGNHEQKFSRYLQQMIQGDIKVKVKGGLAITVDILNQLPANLKRDAVLNFEQMYNRMHDYLIVNDTFVFAHGGIHEEFWSKTYLDPNLKNGKIRNVLLYGEVDGFQEDGYPNRTYNWAQSIPSGMNVFIGHDVAGDQPTVQKNSEGGVLHMVDTGSGKGGHLSAVLVDIKDPANFRHMRF